jgi:hypothetical protein
MNSRRHRTKPSSTSSSRSSPRSCNVCSSSSGASASRSSSRPIRRTGCCSLVESPQLVWGRGDSIPIASARQGSASGTSKCELHNRRVVARGPLASPLRKATAWARADGTGSRHRREGGAQCGAAEVLAGAHGVQARPVQGVDQRATPRRSDDPFAAGHAIFRPSAGAARPRGGPMVCDGSGRSDSSALTTATLRSSRSSCARAAARYRNRPNHAWSIPSETVATRSRGPWRSSPT